MRKLIANSLAGLTMLFSAGALADAEVNPVSNFAVGGARTDSGNLTGFFVPVFPQLAAAQGLVVPGLQQQVGWAQATLAGNINEKKDLFVINGGTNDMLTALITQNPDIGGVIGSAMGNIYGAMDAMYGLGGRYFAVPNLPPLGRLPILGATQVPQAVAQLNYLSILFNGALESTLGQFRATHPDAVVTSVNLFGATEGALASGIFTNTTDACYDPQSGQNPPVVADGGCDGYAFVDTVHPTAAMYDVWADTAYSAIQAALAASTKPSERGIERGGVRRIVSLGDSLLDGGSFDDLWLRSMGFDFLPDVTYTHNVFSTGPGLIEYLEEALGVNSSNKSLPYIQ